MIRMGAFRPAVSLAAIALTCVAGHPPQAATTHGGYPMAAMSEAAMQRMGEAWFARHPETPSRTAGVITFADTVLVKNFVFDTDGNTANIDTVKINEGDTVLWQWVNGSHTITSGTGSADPNAGVMFNANSNTANRQFQFTFPNAGVYPYFCVFHEGSNMIGYVQVQSLTGVPSSQPARAGFVTDPAPVPSRGGVAFRFALSRAGHARADVFDVRGRRVTTVLDAEYGIGVFPGAWNGRAAAGSRVASGVYYLRLTLPGSTATRRIVIAD